MPHIIIEHPESAEKELNLTELSQALHNFLAEQESVNKVAIKTRTMLARNVFVGEEDQANKFIHITIKLLTGRSQELRELISKRMFEKAKSLISDEYALSLETRELGIYFK